jgi:glycosyltransferase involved in cell wall biosynthesis
VSGSDGPRVALTVEQVWQRTPGGSGTYVVELSRELSARPDIEPVGIAAWHRGPAPAAWPLTIPVRRAPLPRRALYDAWQQLHLPRAEHLVRHADVVHATTWAVPPTRRPLVVTVHDLAFLHDRSHFTERGNAFFRRALEQVRDRAAAVLVPSSATADDCVAEGIPAERITVVPHGARVTRPSAAQLADWRARHGVAREYVMWCGTVEPRKNLATLLSAFARADLADVDLVLVGPQGWGRLPEEVAALPPDRVHVLGSLSRTDLDAAYAGARAFCFPSIREGFGLPVLEAMTHGVPVVTSAGTACAEVAGDAALLVDPLDVGALADALRSATGDAHDDLAARSQERARDFSWEQSATTTVDVYREAARQG